MGAGTPIPALHTERLVLRGFGEADLDGFAAISADPEVMEFVGRGRTLDRQEAWRAIAFFLGHWSLRGFGQWALEQRATGQLIGRAGLHRPEGWPGLEVGWLLDREHWGAGYATEAGRAALAWAAAELGAREVVSVIEPGNGRSIRVAERLGLERAGPVEVLGIAAELWRARLGPGRARFAPR